LTGFASNFIINRVIYMNQNSKEELFSYLKQTTGSAITSILPLAGLPALFFFLNIYRLMNGKRGLSVYLWLMATGLILVFLLKAAFSTGSRHRKYMRALEKREDFPRLLADFQTSVSMAEDEIRLGDTYFFVNASEWVYAYEDVDSLHQYVHSTNYVEDKRELRGKMKNGDDIFCKLPLKTEGSNEYSRIALFMLQKNPRIQINKR